MLLIVLVATKGMQSSMGREMGLGRPIEPFHAVILFVPY